MKTLKTKLLRVFNPNTGEYEFIDTLQGKSGESVFIESVNESNVSGGTNIITFSDGKTMSIKNGKDATSSLDCATKEEGAFFVEGTGTTDEEANISTWTGTSDRITTYYDGLTIRYKIGVVGESTTTLNINNLGAKTVYRFGSTKLTTQFPVGSIIHLIYHEDLNEGCWMCSDYDANTNTYQRVYVTTTNKEYPITARYNTTTGSTYYAEYGRYSTGVTLNPSTNTITATTFKGTATKATADANGNNIADTYATKAQITGLGLPTPTTADAGKILRVNAEGKYELVSIPNAEEATF